MRKQCANCSKQAVKNARLCGKCNSEDWRNKNPVRYAYNNLKHNAKKRGKEFDLTYEEFERFCVKTDYMMGKGRTAESYHIDRVDESKGYTITNITLLTNSQNMKKSLGYRYGKGEDDPDFIVTTFRPATFPDVPF